MKTINFSIKFFGYWHIGSGLSGGTKADNLVLKDQNNIPYIPGKTIKGLFRHAAEELSVLSNHLFERDLILNAFGDSGYDLELSSPLFFSDVMLNQSDSTSIIKESLSESLYEVLSSTKIAENGTAEDKSLRQMEVTVPLILYGSIQDFSGKYESLLVRIAPMIKNLGLNRNRGLGRCEIKFL
jgi:CRISPR/Cas system CSM-associated protein Csm3 (group 7 of RAMP superfamily)